MKISERKPGPDWEVTNQQYVKEYDPKQLIDSINSSFTVGVASGYDLLSEKDRWAFADIQEAIDKFVDRYEQTNKPSYYLQGLYGLIFKISDKMYSMVLDAEKED